VSSFTKNSIPQQWQQGVEIFPKYVSDPYSFETTFKSGLVKQLQLQSLSNTKNSLPSLARLL